MPPCSNSKYAAFSWSLHVLVTGYSFCLLCLLFLSQHTPCCLLHASCLVSSLIRFAARSYLHLRAREHYAFAHCIRCFRCAYIGVTRLPRLPVASTPPHILCRHAHHFFVATPALLLGWFLSCAQNTFPTRHRGRAVAPSAGTRVQSGARFASPHVGICRTASSHLRRSAPLYTARGARSAHCRPHTHLRAISTNVPSRPSSRVPFCAAPPHRATLVCIAYLNISRCGHAQSPRLSTGTPASQARILSVLPTSAATSRLLALSADHDRLSATTTPPPPRDGDIRVRRTRGHTLHTTKHLFWI